MLTSFSLAKVFSVRIWLFCYMVGHPHKSNHKFDKLIILHLDKIFFSLFKLFVNRGAFKWMGHICVVLLSLTQAPSWQPGIALKETEGNINGQGPML